MNLPLTLDALQVLDAIDRKGSFAGAATSLNRVPSAISYTVQKLEQDLGISLFHKQGRKSVLTNAGRHLLERGRELIHAAEAVAASTQQVATGWEPRLRIALDHLLAADAILPMLQELYVLQPGIQIELTQEVLGGTWEALMEDRVDLIIGCVASPPGHQGIRCLAWQTLEMIFVAAPDHPLCQQPAPLTNDALQPYRAVIVRDSSSHQAAQSRGFLNRTSFIYVPDMTMKIEAHRCGLGIGSVPRLRVQQLLAQGSLQELTLTEPLPPAILHIGWRTANRGQALHWLVNRLQQLHLS